MPTLSDLKVIAGQNGLDRQISTVTLLDAPDGPKWLKGEEFVLTSAYIFNNSYEQFETYILALIENKASGLGIKTGRFLSAIPDRILNIATSNRFPIVQIPYNLVWTDIIAPFYKLKYGLKDYRMPVVIKPDMILPLFEASRWDGKRLLLQMTEMFQLPIALYGRDKKLILNNGINGTAELEQAAADIKIFPDSAEPERVTIDHFICGFFWLPLSYDGERQYLSVASEQAKDIDEIQKLMDLLQNLSSKDNLALTEKSDAYRAFLHKVITSKITSEEIATFEEGRTGSKTDIIYSGILILNSTNYLQLYEQFKEALDLYWQKKELNIETYLLDYVEKQQAIVLWEVYTPKKLKINVWARGLMSLINTMFADKLEGQIALSSMTTTLKNIVQTVRQAQKALELGELLWPQQQIYFFPDYHIYDLISKDDMGQIDFEDCILLLEDKSTMAFQPIESAEVFIESGNYKRAAAKLFIHENTLRYRINKINELLNIDLENAIERYQFLTKIKLWKIYSTSHSEL